LLKRSPVGIFEISIFVRGSGNFQSPCTTGMVEPNLEMSQTGNRDEVDTAALAKAFEALLRKFPKFRRSQALFIVVFIGILGGGYFFWTSFSKKETPGTTTKIHAGGDLNNHGQIITPGPSSTIQINPKTTYQALPLPEPGKPEQRLSDLEPELETLGQEYQLFRSQLRGAEVISKKAVDLAIKVGSVSGLEKPGEVNRLAATAYCYMVAALVEDLIADKVLYPGHRVTDAKSNRNTYADKVIAFYKTLTVLALEVECNAKKDAGVADTYMVVYQRLAIASQCYVHALAVKAHGGDGVTIEEAYAAHLDSMKRFPKIWEPDPSDQEPILVWLKSKANKPK